MENILSKTNEFGNYLNNNCNDENAKNLIKVLLLNQNLEHILLFIKMLRVEDENENKTIVELDENKVEKIVHKYSQVNEFINIFGLINNVEVKNKVLEYLNILLEFKKIIIY